MSNKKQLKNEDLKKVTGGDDIVDMTQETLKQQEEERLKKLVEDVDKNSQDRRSNELNDLVEDMTDILKKMTGTEDSDGKIHI